MSVCVKLHVYDLIIGYQLSSALNHFDHGTDPWNYDGPVFRDVQTKLNMCGLYVLFVANQLFNDYGIPDVIEESDLWSILDLVHSTVGRSIG